jgi:hypothetical protein
VVELPECPAEPLLVPVMLSLLVCAGPVPEVAGPLLPVQDKPGRVLLLMELGEVGAVQP